MMRLAGRSDKRRPSFCLIPATTRPSYYATSFEATGAVVSARRLFLHLLALGFSSLALSSIHCFLVESLSSFLLCFLFMRLAVFRTDIGLFFILDLLAALAHFEIGP